MLVVGGTGFIGRHLLGLLLQEGHVVYSTYNPAQNPPDLSAVRWVPCDLASADPTRGWPVDCHSLVYLAQSPTWRLFPDGVADVFQVNVAAVMRATEFARRVGMKRLIFVSSGNVYTQTKNPAREGDQVDVFADRSFYSASKLAAELLLGPYRSLLPVVILRPFFPYGAGQHHEMLIPQLIRRVRNGLPIRLHGVDGLLANPVACSDVVQVLSRCLALDASATLNVAGPQTMTLRQIGTCIGRALGADAKFEIHPEETAPVIVGDTTALRATIGWAPDTPFDAGLQDWLTREQGAATR